MVKIRGSKTRKLSKKRKLNEYRGTLESFAEIRGKLKKIGKGGYAIRIISLGGGHPCLQFALH